MRPPFALTLSLDGLTLLHRTKGGWERVGAVALDGGDLDNGMAALRATAETLEPGRVSCKLVLPDDQVRYLTIDAVTDGPEAAEAAALAALDGATPYAVEDLAVDIVQADGALRIAAVARETLGEAEYFARGYGLNPVSFVADPAEGAFAGEPFFGMTHHARDWLAPGETVERDRLGVSAPDPLQSAPRQAPWPAPQPESTAQGLAEPPADPFVTAEPPVEPSTPTEPEAPDTAAPIVFKSRKAASVAPAPDAPETPETSEPRMGGASRPRIERPQGIVPADMDAPATQPEYPPAEPEGPALTRVADLAGSEAAALSTAPPAGQAPRIDAPFHPEPDAAPVAPPTRAPAPERAPQAIAPRGPVDTPPPRPVMAADPGADEALRMTVFGAREAQQQRGKPRYLGLILTALLLIFLAGVAAWATLIADRDTLSALWPGERAQETPEVAAPALPDPITPSEPVETSEPEVAVVVPPDPAPGIGLTESVPEAPAPEPVAEVAPETPPGPTLPQPGASQTLNDLFTPELDVAIAAEDALALPPAGSLDTDRALGAIPNPAPAGSQFDLDARGLVIATQDGALAPEGHMVVLGAPPVQPPSIPLRVEPTLESETEAVQARLAAFRPRARPDDLAEQFERSQLAGRLRSELAQIKPLARPPSVQDAEDIDRTQTEFAVARSPTPVVRPANLRRPAPQPAAEPAARAPEPQQVAAVAPRTVTPRIPSSASVARRATIDNAINLNRVNLIGVYGSPSNRRALVRLPSGRYKKVKVGDRVDGGRVVAISESELRYQKGSRTVRLRMPRG